jgi:hypothetical protein
MSDLLPFATGLAVAHLFWLGERPEAVPPLLVSVTAFWFGLRAYGFTTEVDRDA